MDLQWSTAVSTGSDMDFTVIAWCFGRVRNSRASISTVPCRINLQSTTVSLNLKRRISVAYIRNLELNPESRTLRWVHGCKWLWTLLQRSLECRTFVESVPAPCKCERPYLNLEPAFHPKPWTPKAKSHKLSINLQKMKLKLRTLRPNPQTPSGIVHRVAIEKLRVLGALKQSWNL